MSDTATHMIPGFTTWSDGSRRLWPAVHVDKASETADRIVLYPSAVVG